MAAPLALELIALLEPLAESHGLELVTVEVIGGGRHQTIRVYLDREGGIDIEAISAANAWVSEALDAVSKLSGSYTLEVSSPGIERILRTRRDFERFAGENVNVQLLKPLEGRSRFTGRLVALHDDAVIVEIDGQEHRVPLASIERARLKADFGEVGERSGS